MSTSPFPSTPTPSTSSIPKVSATATFHHALRAMVKESCQETVSSLYARITTLDTDTANGFTKADRKVMAFASNLEQDLKKVKAKANERYTTHQLSIERVEGTMDDLSDKINTLDSQVQSLHTFSPLINSLSARIDTLQNASSTPFQINGILSSVALHQQDINNLTAAIALLSDKISSMDKVLKQPILSSMSKEVRGQFLDDIVREVGAVRDQKIDAFNETLTGYNKEITSFRAFIDGEVRKWIKQQEESTTLKIQQVKLDMEKKATDYMLERSTVRSELEAYIDKALNERVSLHAPPPVTPSLAAIVIREEEKKRDVEASGDILAQVDDKLHEFQANITKLLNEWSGVEHQWAKDLISQAITEAAKKTPAIQDTPRPSSSSSRKRKASVTPPDMAKALEEEAWPSYLRPRESLPPSMQKQSLTQQLSYARKHPYTSYEAAVKRCKLDPTEEEDSETEDEGEAEYTPPAENKTEAIDLRCDETLSFLSE
jgi:hypothetical protein